MNQLKLKIHSIDFRGSISDGPGIRTVVYMQGCHRHCQGCHNPTTWALNAGRYIEIDQLINDIEINTPSQRVTFSGGEPLIQIQPLMALIFLLKEKKFDVAVYTGFSLKEVPKKLLAMLDYIKVGAFDISKKCTVNQFIGSTNQKFIDVQSILY